MTDHEKCTTISTMGFEAKALSRFLRAVWMSAAGAALLSACVSAQTSNRPADRPANDVASLQEPAEGFGYREAHDTLRSGLKSITQRYIEPVRMDKVALDGMRGLATIDPAFKIQFEDGIIRLHLNDVNIADFPRPLSNKAGDWANLTTEIIRAGRTHSPDLKDADNERVYEAVFDGMLSGLDIFSRYSGAEEARANRARRDGFGGIGIRFTKANKGIKITHIQLDSPADIVGLKSSDVILKVNERPLAKMSLRQVAKLLRGPVGAPITLKVARLDTNILYPNRQIRFRLNRAHIVPQTVRAKAIDGILQLRVTGFNKKTSSSVHDILRNNEAAFDSGRLIGVVIDLRGNPGGLLSQSVNVADLFLDQGQIISTRGRHPDSFHDYRAGGFDITKGKPLVILVDGDSASAAEIVASALQDLGRAVVVGSSSYGKGTVQTVIRLPNDGEMTLTWSRLVSPSGYALHGLGVMPAVCATNVPGNLSDDILAPDHIDGQRAAMTAWRAAGMIFDGRRSRLRQDCPAKVFSPVKTDDFLMHLATHVINNPVIYRRAIVPFEALNTASR
ncbi:MAG: S41 family peptidase [Magnetovibrio sp.]|nr:S41 family peptidase [Magnetovibrio sp.]